MEKEFWKNKKVFITGNTGFKGTWLTLMLQRCGAKVYGYSNSTPTTPCLFELVDLGKELEMSWNDVREYSVLHTFLKIWEPEFVIHLAAQAIVKDGYRMPRPTINTNLMGTVNLLDACMQVDSIKNILIVTTDKVYGDANSFRNEGYLETDPMRAADPYSTSKAMAELAVSCWNQSFIQNRKDKKLTSARAGNVVGFGDWAYRVIPMTMEYLMKEESPCIWDPYAIRPWQSVLDCLNGYLTLMEHNHKIANSIDEAWNFGPPLREQYPVGKVVDKICALWSSDGPKRQDAECPVQYHLNVPLVLHSDKARYTLKWTPKWKLDKTLENLVSCYKRYQKGDDVRSICEDTLDDYGI